MDTFGTCMLVAGAAANIGTTQQTISQMEQNQIYSRIWCLERGVTQYHKSKTERQKKNNNNNTTTNREMDGGTQRMEKGFGIENQKN